MELLWFVIEGIPAFFQVLLLLFGGAGQEATNPPLASHSDSEMTTSAPANSVVLNEPSEATEDGNTPGIGNFQKDDDVVSPPTNTLYNETQNSEDEVSQVDATTMGGLLNNPHDFVIKNSMLVDNPTYIINHGVHDRAGKAKKLLLKHMISGAAHDSSARDPPPQCHPGTRIKINERIVAWFYDEIKHELILWIYGPAGVGKSAIVQTFAETLALAKCLGASVFFSRPNGRNNSHAVFITIAYQLAVHIEPYFIFISELLAFDPEIVNKSIEEQYKAFIVKPFVEKNIGAGGKKWGILLDGLDELDERDRQQEIIRLITTFVRDHPKAPLLWVISSRPEPHITNTFKQQGLISSYREEYVPIDSPESCQDVERYLRSSFKAIQQVKFPHIVTEGWPEETKIVKLANAASGLFAFADVAIRFIGDPNYADPISRLDDVLTGVDSCRTGSTDDHPLALLDALYTRILIRIQPNTWPTAQRVLGAIAASKLNSSLDCAKGLSVVLGLRLSKIYSSINDFYSLLEITPLSDVYDRQFRFHHASFVDFLRDPARSKEFYTSKEIAGRDVDESSVRIWLDFRRNFAPGPSAGYRDQWSKYASKFHSDANQPADVLCEFNDSLFSHIHSSLLLSLQERLSPVEREGLQHRRDELLAWLSQMDAGTACYGLSWTHEGLIDLWFDTWNIHREELTSRGIAREIQLQDLHLDSLEQTEEAQIASTGVGMNGIFLEFGFPRSSDKYASYFKYIQERHPELQVLICGPPGSRFVMFKFKITEDDFTNMPLGSIETREYIQCDTVTMYHCFPCSDDA